MKIIISPSKTMKYRNDHFEIAKQNFTKETQYLYHILKQYNDEELAQLMKISSRQAQQVYRYYHDEQQKYPALSLYQGTVFKQLQTSLYHEHTDYLSKHLCIMSAYYGVLNYNSGIAPYRLDMMMKPNQINLYDYWYTPIYQYFEGEDIIISLASQEFNHMIHHPHLYFIDFIEMKNNKPKRNAMIIKKARGQMLNQMILQEITTLQQLKELKIDGFVYDEYHSHDHDIAFVRKGN